MELGDSSVPVAPLPVTTAPLPSTSASTSSLSEGDVQRIAQAVATILKKIEALSFSPLMSEELSPTLW